MSSEAGYREQQLEGLAAMGGTGHIKRLALVVAHPRASHAVSMIRNTVPTFSIRTLAELRAALTSQFADDSAVLGQETSAGGLGALALDISELPLPDVGLFAVNLKSVPQLGVLYILTPNQFDLFEDGTFDFVVR
jgi:hypothetical protein